MPPLPSCSIPCEVPTSWTSSFPDLFLQLFTFQLVSNSLLPPFLFDNFESDQTGYAGSVRYSQSEDQKLEKCIFMEKAPMRVLYLCVFVMCVLCVGVLFVSVCLYVVCVCICMCLCKGSSRLSHSNIYPSWPVCLGVTNDSKCSALDS